MTVQEFHFQQWQSASSSKQLDSLEGVKDIHLKVLRFVRQQEFLGLIFQRRCPQKASLVFVATFLIQAFAELKVSSGA